MAELEIVERLEASAELKHRYGNHAEAQQLEQAASLIQSLAVRVQKLEERLEIASCYVLGENDELVSQAIPPEERDGFPDGISARDETIKLQDERIKEQSATISSLAEALEPFAKAAELFELGDGWSDTDDIGLWFENTKLDAIEVIEFRRARSVYDSLKKKESGG